MVRLPERASNAFVTFVSGKMLSAKSSILPSAIRVRHPRQSGWLIELSGAASKAVAKSSKLVVVSMACSGSDPDVRKWCEGGRRQETQRWLGSDHRASCWQAD